MEQFRFFDSEKQVVEDALKHGNHALDVAKNEIIAEFGSIDGDAYERLCKVFAIASLAVKSNNTNGLVTLSVPNDGPKNRRCVRLYFEVPNFDAVQVMHTRRCTQLLSEMVRLSDYYFISTDQENGKCYLTHTFEIWLFDNKTVQ